MSQFPLFDPWSGSSSLFGGLGYYGSWSNQTPIRVDVVPTDNGKATGKGPLTGDQFGAYGVGSALGSIRGYANAPFGNYQTWRLMDRHSTLALARMLVSGPILTGTRHFEVCQQPGQTKRKTPITGDGVITDPLDKRAEFCDQVFKPFQFNLISDCLRALSLGHYPFEVVWDAKGGQEIISNIKPLLPERCQLLVDKLGNLIGIRNQSNYTGAVDLYGRRCFNYANHPEAGYWYGSSRHENCREEWWEKLQAKMKGAQLDQKAAGVTMVVKGPVGTGKVDSNGAPLDGASSTEAAARAIMGMTPVWVPNSLMGPPDPKQMGNLDYVKAYKELAELSAFDFEQFDWKDTASASGAILEKLKYIDIELMRAWHRPEREAMESQHGSRADSGNHGDIGAQDSDLVHMDICWALSVGPVNDLLERNFGPDARDSVYLKAAPIQDAQVARINALITTLAANPVISTDIYSKLDKTKAFASQDWPVADGKDANEELPEPPAPVPPTAPAKPGDKAKPGDATAMLSMIDAFESGEVVELSASEDLTGGEWRTIDGAHVYIKDGKVEAGPAHLKGLKEGEVRSKTVPGLHEKEHALAELKHEEGHILSTDGTEKAKLKQDGNTPELNLSKEQEGHAKDSILTHNHPDGTALSEGDFFQAARINVHQMRAVTKDGSGNVTTFSISRPAGGWPSSHAIQEAIGPAGKDAKAETDAKHAAGDFNNNSEARAHIRRRTGEKLAEKLGIDYHVESVK